MSFRKDPEYSMKIYSMILVFLISAPLFSQTKIKVAVLEFEAKGISETEASILTDRFRTVVINLDTFNVYERELTDRILDEQGFQQSGIISDKSMVHLGRMIGVEQIISGSCSLIGETYTVTARIIDVSSGRILKSASVDHLGSLDGLLGSGMHELAETLFKKGAVIIRGKPIIDRVSEISITPLQIALFYPVQIYNDKTNVRGLKINIVHGLNHSVYGLDAGVINEVSHVILGIQAGLINKNETIIGVQAGLVNSSKKVGGLQVGLVNSTDNMFGLQVGLLNSIKNGPFQFLPFINAAFSIR